MVYSPDGPIRRRKRGDILPMDQSDAGSAGIFSRWTNRVLPSNLPKVATDRPAASASQGSTQPL
eukprot:5496150-Pyramimonas_sp.AAC.1